MPEEMTPEKVKEIQAQVEKDLVIGAVVALWETKTVSTLCTALLEAWEETREMKGLNEAIDQHGWSEEVHDD